MHTEDEAKGKWCPFSSVDVSRLSDEELVERSQGFHGENVWSQACIASECMAWRWEFSLATAQRTGNGYCGLAEPIVSAAPAMLKAREGE